MHLIVFASKIIPIMSISVSSFVLNELFLCDVTMPRSVSLPCFLLLRSPFLQM